MKTNLFDAFVMNLQLFAYDPTAQPVNYTGSSDLSVEMKTYYDMNLVDEASPLLVHEQFADDSPIPKNHGKTIEWRKYAPLAKAITPLTEGVTPDGKALVVSNITATINQYGDFVVLTDILKLTAIDNNVLEATKLLGRQSGLTMDTVVRNELLTGGTARYASSWSGTTETTHSARKDVTKTSTLTVYEVQKAVRSLRRNNAPTFPDGYYRAIVHPDVLFDLMRDPDWTDAHKYAAPEELFKGEVGRIAGVRFVQTTEAKIFKGANLNGSSRTLTAGATSASTTVSLSGSPGLTVDALKDRYVLIGNQRVKVTANAAAQLTVDTAVTCDASTTVYPGEGGAEGCAIYICQFLGKGAYRKTSVEGGGLETIIEPPHDPLHQKSSIGWKGTKTAKIIHSNYIVSLECSSSNSDEAVEN